MINNKIAIIFSFISFKVKKLLVLAKVFFSNLVRGERGKSKILAFPLIKWPLFGTYCVNRVTSNIFILMMWQFLGLKSYWIFWIFCIFVTFCYMATIAYCGISFHLSHILASLFIFIIFWYLFPIIFFILAHVSNLSHIFFPYFAISFHLSHMTSSQEEFCLLKKFKN